MRCAFSWLRLSVASDFPANAKLDGEIGSLLLNKTKAEITQRYRDRITLFNIPTAGETIPAIKFSLYDSDLELLLEENRVYRIDVKDPIYRTRKGIKVGDKLKNIVAKYPNGQFYAGIGEGEYISYQIYNGSFIFSIETKNIPYERFSADTVKITDEDVLTAVVELIVLRNEVK